jgi:rod shape-determining protein MreD
MGANNSLLIIASLLVTLIATIMPLPMMIDPFRPDWVLLALLYWSLALPARVNVFTAWVLGLLLDILLGSLLGVHAAAMAISVYIVSINYHLIRNFSILQQSLIIGLSTALYHLIVFWLQYILLDVVFLSQYLYPVITSIVLWPWVFYILRKIRRSFKIK